MRNPSSLTGSPRSAEVESRMHAFVANGGGAIEFWRLGIQAKSVQPCFCKYSCTQPSGDDLTDVENYFNFVIGHTWFLNDPDEGGEYQQTDALDPDTLQATSATADLNTFTNGLFDTPVWNDLIGYTYNTPPDPAKFLSTSGADWDKSATRAGIIAALDAVDWTALWNGSLTEPGNFEYDRFAYAPADHGVLPFDGSLPAGGTGSGNLIGYGGGFGPALVQTGAVGDLGVSGSAAESVSDGGLGVGLFRNQIQIRNFRGASIPYFIYERADVAGGVTVINAPFPTNTIREDTSIALADTRIYVRKLSEGVWDHDRQIIQLPDAPMDGPQRLTAPAGTRVRNGSTISMVVGLTFEAWAAATFGPSWADYVFT